MVYKYIVVSTEEQKKKTYKQIANNKHYRCYNTDMDKVLWKYSC